MSNREGSLINRSHGRRISARKFIQYALQNDEGEFWQVKYNLADTLVAQYNLPIGIANHLIEQEARRMGQR